MSSESYQWNIRQIGSQVNYLSFTYLFFTYLLFRYDDGDKPRIRVVRGTDGSDLRQTFTGTDCVRNVT